MVCINLSSELSATMAAAENAARASGRRLPGPRGRLQVDHRRPRHPGAARRRGGAEGASADDVVALVEDLRERTHVFGSLDTLENLKKGGRIGGAQAMLGSLLSIKPMIDISTGVVEEARKDRTRKKSLQALRDKISEFGPVEHLAIMHGMAPDIDVMDGARRPDIEYRFGHIGAVIGTHGGPRVIGACWVDGRAERAPVRAGPHDRGTSIGTRSDRRVRSEPCRSNPPGRPRVQAVPAAAARSRPAPCCPAATGSVAPIATGGMATVWRAVDEILTRPVAVKILHAHLAADPEFVARFRREAVAAARLAHPSIVAIYDTCSEPEAIVMELVDGRTLRDELDARGFLPPAEAVEIASGIAQALEVAHKAGLVHRDVKPANVLLSHDGRLKVADFGIAKAARRRRGPRPPRPDQRRSHGRHRQVPGPRAGVRWRDRRPDRRLRPRVRALRDAAAGGRRSRAPTTSPPPPPASTARPERPRSVLRTIPMRLDEIVMRALATRPRPSGTPRPSAMWADLQAAPVESEAGGVGRR